jgi:hypothetical protein
MKWSEADIKKLLQAGKIQGYKSNPATSKTPAGRIVSKLFKKKSTEKNWMAETLFTWCSSRALVLREEYRFHDKRKWRFDWCIEELKVAFEYEGIYSVQSRHTNRKGYSRDTEKYNAAVALGWRVFRYTASTYKNLENDLKCMCS